MEDELEKPAQDLEDVKLVEGDPTKVTKVRGGLNSTLKDKIVDFLKQNLDVFAWNHEDMPGTNNKVIEHRLNVDPTKSLSNRSKEFLLLGGIKLLWKK